MYLISKVAAQHCTSCRNQRGECVVNIVATRGLRRLSEEICEMQILIERGAITIN